MSTDPQNQYDDYRLNHHSSISMTQAMWVKLEQVVENRRDPKFNQSDAVREAIRFYLDNQEDLIGSRKHFGRSLQRSLSQHEQTILFTLHALLLLVARLFIYIIKSKDGREIDPMKLIESSIVDSKLLSKRLIEATAAGCHCRHRPNCGSGSDLLRGYDRPAACLTDRAENACEGIPYQLYSREQLIETAMPNCESRSVCVISGANACSAMKVVTRSMMMPQMMTSFIKNHWMVACSSSNLYHSPSTMNWMSWVRSSTQSPGLGTWA